MMQNFGIGRSVQKCVQNTGLMSLRKLILVNVFVGWLWWYYQGKQIGSGGFLCYLVWALQNDCSSPRGNDPIFPSMSANILWWDGTYTNKFFINQHLCINIKSELFNAVLNCSYCIQITVNLKKTPEIYWFIYPKWQLVI